MPRTLVINGKFNPFSYDELVKPLRTATEQHQQVEAAYGELGAAADLWADIAMNEKDSEAAAMYSKYSDDLRKQADNLALYGLNGNSRRELFNMKRRYASEIQPIENAYNARVEDIKLQRELSAKDPSLLWNSSASSASIDSYLHGNRPDYYSVSGDDMYKRAMTGAKAISDRYFRTKEGSLFNGAYWDLIQSQGVTPAEAMAILQNTGDFPEFNTLVESIKSGSNYDKLSDSGKLNIDNRILEGINAGLGYTEKHNPEQNWVLRENMSFNNSLKLAQEKQAMKGGAGAGRSELPMNVLQLQMPGQKGGKDTRRSEKLRKGSIMSAISSSSDPSAKIDMRKALKESTLMDNGHLVSKSGDSRFSLFDANGNMLSRERFLSQAADTQTRNNLGRIYDDFQKDLKKAGYSGSETSFNEINSYINSAASANNSAVSFGIEIPIGTIGGGNDEVFNQLRSKTSNGLQIEEISGFAGDHVATSGKPLDISKLDTKSLNYALTYDGLVVFDGNQYGLVRPENIGSLAVTSIEDLDYYRQINEYARASYDEARRKGYTGDYETYIRTAAADRAGTTSIYQELQQSLEAAMTNMIRALNYSFSSTAINPYGKGNLIGLTTDDEEEE